MTKDQKPEKLSDRLHLNDMRMENSPDLATALASEPKRYIPVARRIHGVDNEFQTMMDLSTGYLVTDTGAKVIVEIDKELLNKGVEPARSKISVGTAPIPSLGQESIHVTNQSAAYNWGVFSLGFVVGTLLGTLLGMCLSNKLTNKRSASQNGEK
uniref:Uncharacterized protein n=1 Tax=Nephroselmis olivacea TaxID=31312 RepID=Q9T3B4_NEPOL|nr:hypothetical protein NeolCp088 [Nephroselmis olivacea]NP_050954.1 hypothetical protein NeolCp149 [Nephroselmis olivacea]AAD54864.1 unknown [Nephroselmis olivacea]AAD54925.1 unknown [Nephroselmis olivacea]